MHRKQEVLPVALEGDGTAGTRSRSASVTEADLTRPGRRTVDPPETALTNSEPIRNAFTVDVEDWYQGIELPTSSWKQRERRIGAGIFPLLDLLDRYETRATFFVLGSVAHEHPELVRAIAERGHELGSHGWSHEKVYDLHPEEFRREIVDSKRAIEDLSGSLCLTYRAPFFSITMRSLWALEILKAEGYEIDCSLSPVVTWRYGIAGIPDRIFRFKDLDLVEFPVSPMSLLGRKFGIGGAYFRLFPYHLSRKAIRDREAEARSSVFYIHPWEYDPDHPRIRFEPKAMITHYANLRKTYPRTERLLRDFRFTTVSAVVESCAAEGTIDVWT
jgi:polysaccharide deacetylase family protein (PEP-CTERM system associated)